MCVQYRSVAVNLPLILIEGEGPLLFGRDWLAFFKLDWVELFREAGVSRVSEPGGPPVTGDPGTDRLLTEFEEVFREELGCFKGSKVNIEVDPEAAPRFFKARPVPLAYRSRVDAELDKQVELGLWEAVPDSRWAAPMVVVPKADGSLRLCGDYRLTVNKAARIHQYPLPRVEELLTKLAGCSVFSKVDLKSAYHQLVLDEQSREYLTLNTPRGLMRPTRLSFGYASAPALFQRTLDTLLSGLTGVAVFLDDVIIAAPSREMHEARLREVLRRLTDAGLSVNRAKCSFGVSSVTYLGYTVSGSGVHATEEKVKAICGAPEPRNVPELQAWLGLINYYSKFLQNLSTVLSPLYRLRRKGEPWVWDAAAKIAFERAKALLVHPPVLAHFDVRLPVVLACDASPTGIGVVLSQRTAQGERPVAFYSRSLNPTEQRYSHTDKEALAVVSGVKKFTYYLAGRPFVIRTDHKPLLGLIGERKPIPAMASPRMVRWALLLGGYDYQLTYVPGSRQGHCDGLSRLPLPCTVPDPPTPAEVVHLLQFLDASPVTVSQVQRWTARDPVLANVLRYTERGWPAASRSLPPEYRPYQQRDREGELSCQGGCVLWGGRVVMPPQGRARILQLLHAGHQGEGRTKAFARAYVWWPRLDDDISHLVRQCSRCNEMRNLAPPVPLHPWEWPKRPYDRIHLDYCGPMDGDMFLIIVDAFSKWVDIYPTTTATTTVTLDRLRTCFATWGLPRVLCSDNAACFTCPAFKQFCEKNGIEHVTSPPLSPKSNGLAERYVQSFKHKYRCLQGSVSARVAEILFLYRNTPHSTTGRTPAELFIGRPLRHHLDLLRPDLAKEVQHRQRVQKGYADRRAQNRTVMVGDAVWVSAVDRLRGAEEKHWLPGVVIDVASVKVTVHLCDGRVVCRHRDQVRWREVAVALRSAPMG